MSIVGVLLALSWIVCWRFFFTEPTQLVRGVPSVPFRASAYVVFAALALWSVSAWESAAHTGCEPAVFAGLATAVLGQTLMCFARRSIPLSNYDLVFSLSPRTVRSGVYAHLTHPMYVGLALALAGTSAAVLDVRGLGFLLFILTPLLWLRGLLERV